MAAGIPSRQGIRTLPSSLRGARIFPAAGPSRFLRLRALGLGREAKAQKILLRAAGEELAARLDGRVKCLRSGRDPPSSGQPSPPAPSPVSFSGGGAPLVPPEVNQGICRAWGPPVVAAV